MKHKSNIAIRKFIDKYGSERIGQEILRKYYKQIVSEKIKQSISYKKEIRNDY